MPPFSPAAKGRLPNSMNEFCPENPCHPSLWTHGGSIRPVESVDERYFDWILAETAPAEPS